MVNFLFGNQEIKKIKDILYKNNIQNPLIIRGDKSFKSFLSMSDELIPQGFKSFVLKSSFIDLELLSEGVAFFDRYNFDCIICVGGGSVIDFGKLISIFSSNKRDYSTYLSNPKLLMARKTLLIAIPTTSGSGSEATHFAVLYDGFKKFSIAQDSLLPDYAIIDPELTYSLPPLQTAISGMDALCQGLESLWSKGSNSLSRDFSKKAIKLAVNNLSNSVHSPNETNRKAMAKSSNLAGRAINISKTTAAHAFSYPLTRFLGIPHGHAVGLTIGRFLVHNFTSKDYKRSSLRIFNELFEILGVSNADEANLFILKLMKDIGLFTKLRSSINYSETVSDIISNVNLERLANNPSKVSEDDLRRIYKSLF